LRKEAIIVATTSNVRKVGINRKALFARDALVNTTSARISGRVRDPDGMVDG